MFAWVQGCEPRVTLLTCSGALAVHSRADKAMTLLTLPFLAAALLRGFATDPSASSPRRRAYAVAAAFALIGSAHALCLLLGVPATLDWPGGIFWLLELAFSAFNALLLSVLGLLNLVWLELHVAAHPFRDSDEAHLTSAWAAATRAGNWLLVAPLMVAVTLDVAAASAVGGNRRAMDHAAMDAQHVVFAGICGVAASRSLWHGCALHSRAEAHARATSPSLRLGARRRAHAALMLLGVLWTGCATFCFACALAGAFRTLAPESSHTHAVDTLLLYTFLVYDMGAILVAKLALVMLSHPALLERLSCVGRGDGGGGGERGSEDLQPLHAVAVHGAKEARARGSCTQCRLCTCL